MLVLDDGVLHPAGGGGPVLGRFQGHGAEGLDEGDANLQTFLYDVQEAPAVLDVRALEA